MKRINCNYGFGETMTVLGGEDTKACYPPFSYEVMRVDRF